MKKIKQIREQYDLVTEKEEAETRKLTTLVRAGLFDPKKLPMLKRALNKDPKDMTPAERKILIELLDSLMGEVLQSQQVYSKVKQNVMMKEEETLDEAKAFDGYYSKYDPRYTKMPSEREIPTIIILKRKAIRIYPDNQKVALYYSQALDKYVTIPFGTFEGGASMNEEIKSDEDNPYTVKSTYTKYKNPEDKKNIMRMHGELQKMKNKMASGQYKDAKSKKTADEVIKARSAALTKTINKAAKSTETKKVDLSKKNPSELSKANFGRLMQGISKDDNLNLATKVGAKVGLKARRAFDKGREGAKKVDTAFEETSVKFIFKNKLDEKREYGPVDAAADIASMTPGPIGSAASLASAGLSLSRGDYAGAALDVAGALPGVGYLAKNVKLATKADKISNITKGADKLGDAIKGTKPSSVPSAGKKPAEPVKPAETTKPAETSKPAETTKPAEPVASPKPAPKQPGRLARYSKGAGKLAAGAASLAGAALGSMAGASVNKKQSTPQPFSMQVKTNKPQGNVRTSVDARDSSLYRKAMQKESVLNALYTINENEEKAIEIANESVVINNTVAKKIIGLYESVNKNNKEKIETMLNESIDSFKKIASFAARQ